MMGSKRSKTEIYADILSAVQLESAQYKKASPTRVAHKANLPYDRFKKILHQLADLQMVTITKEGIVTTEKGTKCLEQIQKNNEFLRRMGLLK
jgi:predicted transcriptional regulator